VVRRRQAAARQEKIVSRNTISNLASKGTESDLEDEKSARLQKRQGCKPNILVFARGTMEGGTMGSTVGPALSRALGSTFRSVGVKYTADIAGDNCIGFPGGMKCVDQLAKLAQQCPTSKFFISGYSQGAMVAHICTAFSKDEVKKRIRVREPVDMRFGS
jgi:hypothetical protein